MDVVKPPVLRAGYSAYRAQKSTVLFGKARASGIKRYSGIRPLARMTAWPACKV